ncbi:hypothetical protein KR222_001389 [Zaprionus bogoriensis]|nr:hypothetical protein KR222_001389 [Zaprionus bogoriensis]
MTDSMKFGPEWLRNMSSEPTAVSSNNVVAAIGGNTSVSLHSGGPSGGNNLASHTNSTTSRNLFPEYRYGREEMLSLFDRNCLLPQILPSFKKLFVDKVQYPLALTPSSEEEINSHSPLGSSVRPAWLQRSAGGFGISSRGLARGGTIERGRMRGKSSYHPIYQRPNVIYDENLSVISIKSDRTWSERNGTGDSTIVGATNVGGAGNVSGTLDWNGTPNSSPRKEFSSHNRNLENWRRNRNEDGSGDGPALGSGVGIEVSGWRSGGTHRWGELIVKIAKMACLICILILGRSTSWRDEEPIQGGNIDATSNIQANNQRSISAIGTVATERAKVPVSCVGGSLTSVNRSISSKWSVNNVNTSSIDGDDSLPEWAIENPSEMGGTFDSSGAFHGDNAETKLKFIISAREHPELEREKTKNEIDSCVQNQTEEAVPQKLPHKEEGDGDNREDLKTNNINTRRVKGDSDSTILQATVVHGDISERFKEVADEVEKLIMDDDCGRLDEIIPDVTNTGRYEITSETNPIKDGVHPQQKQMISQLPDPAGPAMSLSFPDPLSVQHHQHHQLQQQQQHLSALPGHMINENSNILWFYRDPQSNVQGPFSAIEMTEWYRAGYFNENLFVRRLSDSHFRPLGELIKLCRGNMPFTHSHLLPMDLDNIQIPLTRKPPTLNSLPLPSTDQQQRTVDEQLKANVTAAADSLSAAVKGQMTTHAQITDTSHMLTMRFQMLQDQYLQHQEYQILSELSKNDCFQRLDAAQRESIVRSKVQLLVLPEYLSSFNGLSNTLAALNPAAGNQLYDAIAEQAKKDHQQQRTQIFSGNIDQHQRPANIFMDANDFIINAQLMHQQGQRQTQSSSHPDQVQQQHQLSEANKLNELPSNDMELLSEYNLRMLLRGPSTTANQQQQVESQLLVSQNLMMPIWPHQQQHPSEHWPAMSNAKGTLWDVATLEEEQSLQLQLQQQKLNTNSISKSDFNSSKLEFDADTQLNKIEQQEFPPSQAQQSLGMLLKDRQQTLPHQKEHIQAEHQQQQEHQQLECHEQQLTTESKVKKQQPSPLKSQGKQSDIKISDDERRRELIDEKRRLKEERKRQQQEEEKRRVLLAEEEKSRQIQEEKERQHQIQSQRRRALLGDLPSINNAPGHIGTGGGNKMSGTKVEQQMGRSLPTSIAPWSLQSSSVNYTAPGLAEIQKAERRERRADQQRQQEQLDKQMRATALEANDSLVKWQAPPAPAPVMSLVDIQAEEAKRLANELLEQQRRRDHEQHQQAVVPVGISVSGGLSNIWGNVNKAWGSVSSAVNIGVWDDPVNTMGTTTAASVLAAGLLPATSSNTNKQPPQPKTTATSLSSPRNLQKSVTLPAMQNVTIYKHAKSTSNSQQQQEKCRVAPNKGAGKASGSFEDKKMTTKNQQMNNDGTPNSKINEYENEFTIWCMKSLDNMSAKVDVPTFVTFLQDLEAPYEVKDYVRIYLGEGKDSSDFAKQFLERRSKYKNLQRAQNAHNDDMCKPAPAITPSSNENGDNKNKQKKIKKNKMTKMDARILGFSVTAAEGRINVGGRDYVEGP